MDPGITIITIAASLAAIAVSGRQSPAGSAGPIGTAGPPGATGPTGPNGAAGPAGATGAAGATGSIGPTGPTGPQEAAGATGPAGPSLAGLPVEDANGFGGYGVIRVPLIAIAGNADDDVSIYVNDSPALRILSVTAMITGGPGTGIAVVRSAPGGGGTAYSAGFLATVTGLQQETVTRTATQTLAVNSSLYVRRTGTGMGNDITGEILIYVQRM